MPIIDFPLDTPLTDIPGRLRQLADQIEEGRYRPKAVVIVLGDIEHRASVFGFGDIGRSEEALGWLVRGLNSGI